MLQRSYKTDLHQDSSHFCCSEHWGELLFGQRSSHQALCCSLVHSRIWVHHLFAWSRLQAFWINFTAVLRGAAFERHILCEALDRGSNAAHTLRGTGSCTTAIIPSIPVALGPCWCTVACRRCKELASNRGCTQKQQHTSNLHLREVNLRVSTNC